MAGIKRVLKAPSQEQATEKNPPPQGNGPKPQGGRGAEEIGDVVGSSPALGPAGQ